MNRQSLVTGVVPGIALMAIVVVGILLTQQWQIPEREAFARPLVTLLRSNGVRVTHVSHASRYEMRGSHAAGLRTKLGDVIVMQFDTLEAARTGASEVRTWCCHPFYATLDGTRVIVTFEPDVDRLIKRILG